MKDDILILPQNWVIYGKLLLMEEILQMVQDFFHQQYDCESWIRVWKQFDDRIPKNIC